MPLLSTLRGLHVVCPGEIPAELGSLSNLVALTILSKTLAEFWPETGALAGCGKRARRTDVVGGASSSPTTSAIS